MFATHFGWSRSQERMTPSAMGNHRSQFGWLSYARLVPLVLLDISGCFRPVAFMIFRFFHNFWSHSPVSTDRTLELPSRIRGLLSERLGNRRADMWFDSASTVRVEGGKLAVDAESSFAADWIRKNFGGDLRAVSQEALGRDDFDLRVKEASPVPLLNAPPRACESSDPTSPSRPGATPISRAGSTQTWRRLEDFVVGPTNQMAFDAVSTFASSNIIGNCLVIHGHCGVGKSHLLQALCRRRRESRTQQRIRYVTAEQFTNEYIQSVRHGTIDAFRARVRRVDVLAIDDVHFLAGKTATQTEFVHTLDAVQLAGSQVVLASDEHPHVIRRLSQSLTSRMIAGMVVRVDAPDLALRRALVQSVALRKAIALSNEAVDAIACHCVGGAREIEGAFSTLEAIRLNQDVNMQANAHSLQRASNEISCGLIDSLFRREEVKRATNPVRLCEIIDQVCSLLGVNAAELEGASRHRRVTLARGLIAWLARHHTSMSFPEISRAMKRNSHSSIHASVTRIDALIQSKAVVDAGTAGECMIVELLERLRHTLRDASRQRRR